MQHARSHFSEDLPQTLLQLLHLEFPPGIVVPCPPYPRLCGALLRQGPVIRPYMIAHHEEVKPLAWTRESPIKEIHTGVVNGHVCVKGVSMVRVRCLE